MNMKKLRKKHNRYRCLKTISYLLGFPLFIFMVIVGSMRLFAENAYTDIKWYGILACVALWVVSVVLQIVISLITKSYNGRTAFMLIVSLILVLGGAVLCDIYVGSKYDEIAKEYSKHGVEVNTYKHDAGWVSPWTKGQSGVVADYGNSVMDFCKVYNIGYKSSNYGGKNANKVDDIANYKAAHDGKTDGMTDDDFVLSKIVYDKEDDAYYSVNGLYADGYIFGYKQALKVLIDYNQSKFDIENDSIPVKAEDGTETGEVTYKKNGKSADEELSKALAALDTDAEWIAYKNSAEYKEYYNNAARRATYTITTEKLDTILGYLGGGLAGSVGLLLPLLPINIEGLNAEFLKNLTLDSLLTLVNKVLADNNVTGTLELFGMTIDLSQGLTEEVVLGLVENFSFYVYPTLKPKFMFIKDETIRTYALAKYYAESHGSVVGSVLIGDQLGQVLMGGGKSYPADKFGYSLNQLYTMKAQGELAQYYPFMIARKYAYICAGIIALMTVCFYINKRKEDEMFEIIANGGRR